jgi:hypothetical protein
MSAVPGPPTKWGGGVFMKYGIPKNKTIKFLNVLLIVRNLKLLYDVM